MEEEREDEKKVVEAEKVVESSDTSPIGQIISTTEERIASLDRKDDTLDFFQTIGKIDSNSLKKITDATLKRTSEGIHSRRHQAFVLLRYLLRSTMQIIPILLENPDDWAKAILNKEKYIQWKTSIPEQPNTPILDQYKIMLDLMQEEGLYKAEIISQLQTELKVIAGSGRRD